MSLFDSVYDEAGGTRPDMSGDDAPEGAEPGMGGDADAEVQAAPVRTLAEISDDMVDVMGEVEHHAEHHASDESNDDGHGDAAPVEQPLEVDDEGGDLHGFATALFAAVDGQGAQADLEDVTGDHAGNEAGAVADDVVPFDDAAVEPPVQPDASPASTFGGLVAGTSSMTATVAAAEVEVEDEPESVEHGEGVGHAEAPLVITLGDDLLPSRPPAGRSAPSLELPVSFSLRKVLLVVLCLVAGFLGYRMLLGGSDSGGSAEPVVPGSAGVPNSPVEAIARADLASAEVQLRQAAVQAEMHFAQAGTYQLSPEQWAARVGWPVVAAGQTPVEGTLGAVAGSDAVCFETLVRGTTAALGLTAQGGAAFTTSPDGTSVCTADAGVIAGWAPTLETS